MSETRTVNIMEILDKKHNEITQYVEQYVKESSRETLKVHKSDVEALAKLKLKLITSVHTRNEVWGPDVEEVDLMGFSVDEVKISGLDDIGRDRIILYMTLPNTREYRVSIELMETWNMVKDVYVKYLEEYNRILQELEKMVKEEEIKRKLAEYEELKKKYEELIEKIRELENKLYEYKEKCREGEEE